ncbi:MAG: hypothetical protein FJ280_01180 [Planctomycetes bacterium]|nr:hypothetical protein [Planctomycetota bacterium]
MKYVVAALILGVLVLGGFSCEGTRTGTGSNPGTGTGFQVKIGAGDGQVTSSEVKPLLLDDEPLLLEDEGGVDVSGGADNHRCHVCHVNYAEEKLAVTHAKAGIGCARCHGESDEHIADESWASGGNGTAPDIIFVRNEINGFCFGCHAAGTLSGSQHAVAVAGSGEKVCTDCHGRHRLPVRRCRWK